MAEAQSSILIVDDDTEDLSSVERALRPLGSDLFIIKDPHEVIRGVHRHRPDVVVIDALLPGLSGFDLCKQIKSDPQLKGTQVLIVTGVYLRQQYRQEAIQQFKADGFLTKPFRPPELQRLVVQLLARKTRAPQSSFLKRIGLPASEPKKRGFFGRIFGRSEEAELARIAPSARDASSEPVETPAPVDAAPEIALDAPREKAPAKKAHPPKVVAEQTKSASAKAALAVEEEPEEQEIQTREPVQAAEPGRPPNGEAPADSETAALASPNPEPAPSPAPEEVVESEVDVPETARLGKLDEGPSPETLLDAPPPVDSEQITWIDAQATTEEMTLEEAAARVAAGENPGKPPAAFEDLAVPQAELEAESKASQPMRRPLFRVGEVPIYDESDFLTELKRELSKCKRVDRPLTLILIRVGDLGQIVELFGKDFRERVLWHIAEQAMGSLREVDLVGMMSSRNLIALTAFASDRYGGGRIVSRMRQAVTRKPFRVGEELPPIIPALDFGMASFPADGSEVSNLMLRAEEDLSPGGDQSAAAD